jgi:hypothetical protein
MYRDRNIHQTAARAKPVLMIPLRRCGSHALRLRLNFSPEFYSPYPLHIVDFIPLLKLYGDLSDDFRYFQLVIDLVGLQNATMVKWDNIALDPIVIFGATKHGFRSAHGIAWNMLFQAGQKHHVKVVMDKSLDNVHYAEELMDLFDDMLFLNVVRDPRAHICSMNRSIIYDFDTLLNTKRWLRAYYAAKALTEKYPEKVLTIKYEDFLDDQEVILKKICSFLGIAFLDTMLDVSASLEARYISELSALWKTNASAPILNYTDKFKKKLSMTEIEIIETLTKDLMKYYGYQRLTKADASITKEMFVEARQRSIYEKSQAWMDLKTNDPRDFQLRRFREDYLKMLGLRLKDRVFRDKTPHIQVAENLDQQLTSAPCLETMENFHRTSSKS